MRCRPLTNPLRWRCVILLHVRVRRACKQGWLRCINVRVTVDGDPLLLRSTLASGSKQNGGALSSARTSAVGGHVSSPVACLYWRRERGSYWKQTVVASPEFDLLRWWAHECVALPALGDAALNVLAAPVSIRLVCKRTPSPPLLPVEMQSELLPPYLSPC
uniref:Uncharacterized protein n=1 Tax=Eutreptiella gymnastica TaxID=73025 RepID=A0A7S4G1I3_9EUGL